MVATPTNQLVQKPLIALAAGGTGGHVFPALAVAEALQRDGFDTLMLTDRRGARLMPASGHITLPAGSPFQRGLLRRMRAIGALAAGTIAALAIMIRRRPRVMIGFGGYPAFAPLLAARLLGTPSLLHEQNAFLGRANRLLARWTGNLAISWNGTANVPPAVTARTLGMPVRAAFFDSPALSDKAVSDKAVSDRADNRLTLTVVGGSLGAGIFADIVPDAISRLDAPLRRRLTVTQQCRAEQQTALRARYADMDVNADIRPFFDDMPVILANSHLVISRAGASSVAELAAAGRPALLVPFAGAMDDHQTMNANQLASVGGGHCLAETDLTADKLAAHLSAMLQDPARLATMGKAARSLAAASAAADIADWAIELGGVAA
jgi:UDP-N-acetylglucosamine--N-acetylmuramyl-(pentapeptide) pyrophosphoryl-undecaprenol N-acetylglucosamine transferase